MPSSASRRRAGREAGAAAPALATLDRPEDLVGRLGRLELFVRGVSLDRLPLPDDAERRRRSCVVCSPESDDDAGRLRGGAFEIGSSSGTAAKRRLLLRKSFIDHPIGGVVKSA